MQRMGGASSLDRWLGPQPCNMSHHPQDVICSDQWFFDADPMNWPSEKFMQAQGRNEARR